MQAKQLQAKSGQVYKVRLDPLTVSLMQSISETCGNRIGLKPSQAVLIRRALRYYGDFVICKLAYKEMAQEKKQLLLAAGKTC